MPNSGQEILITGAAGFIGSALAQRLCRASGNRLTLVDRVAADDLREELKEIVAQPNVRYLPLDLMDGAAVARLPRDVQVIYHLAAVIGVEQVLSAPDRVLEVNAVTTLNLFNHAKGLANLKRFLFSSTSEVYAGTLKHYGIPLPTPENVPLCLDDVAAPRTSYALSKIYGEAVAFAWSNVYGVPVTIVRYHNVYGPGMGFRHVIPQTFVKVKQADGQIEVPSADHTRAFCYIDDAVEATIQCAERDETKGQVVHIGSAGEEIAIGSLVRKITDLMQRPLVIRELPATPGSPARRCPDTSTLKRLTGCEAKVSLSEGLQRTYEWYRSRI
jgi:nucleoside-diphosphate-sugar epimerase